MNRFTVDYSSSPNPGPSNDTPQQPKTRTLFSKTPDLASTTPLAPPPSAVFGSSNFGTGVSKLNFTNKPGSAKPRDQRQPQFPTRNTPQNNNSRQFHISFNSSPAGVYSDQDQREYEDDDVTQDVWEDESGLSQFGRSNMSYGVDRDAANPLPSQSLMRFSQSDARRSTSKRKSTRKNKTSQLQRKGQESRVPGLARDLGRRGQPAQLQEPDDVILRAEQLLRQLENLVQNVEDEETLQTVIASCAVEMIVMWRKHGNFTPPSLDSNIIGPPTSASSFAKANYIASLLLALYHPPSSDETSQTYRPMPIPQVILEWLDNYHVSYAPLYQTVASTDPNSSAHPLFWDAVQSLTLRGMLSEVMSLFEDADFQYAATAVDDGESEPGYHGVQLQTVQSVIFRARKILNQCPASKSSEWDADTADWDLFRKKVEAELDHLEELAADRDGDDEDEFQAENFGLRKTKLSLLGRANEKSTSNLPWSIFQNLRIMYSILLGSPEEIIAQSQDWLEATAALTVWWEGSEDTTVAQWSFDVSRASGLKDDGESAENPFLTRLRDAFLYVTDPDDKNSFQINGMSPVEVGLGCVLQGDMEGVLTIAQFLSRSIASSIAEIGSHARWLKTQSASRLPDLGQEDLMVLNYGADKQSTTKDDVLLNYAEALFDRQQLVASNGEIVNGWEVAISTATRMDDEETMRSTVGGFLDELQIQDQDRAERLINLCTDLGLLEEAQKVSERFGDHLVNNTSDYGIALLSYGRSHSSAKIRQLIDLLVSYCLVQSRAYPSEEEMDDGLRNLVSNPKIALSDIAEVDPEAAEVLQFYLVGYACLRRFYNLRDDEIHAQKEGRKPTLRPKARKRAAAKALIAVINSAADSIYGGLYDPDRQSAIQVDGLLTLLGEATAFISQETHFLSSEQMYSLLAAIEDLETVSQRVRDATEECLQAALRNYNGSLPPSPHAMLKKSMSSGTNSNFSFSMMGSEMLARSGETTGGVSMGSAVLVAGPGKGESERGWDWRAKFASHETIQQTNGAAILKLLRVGIAKELSIVELDG